MCDKLVFDLAQEVEGSPNVFIRKDWINILDNQNQNYNNNQSVVDTSQLSNSNKYMSYREAYFSIPFIITLGSTGRTSTGAVANETFFTPTAPLTSVDSCVGLKSWFGQIIHSFTVDYNGTTIIQQTPYIQMWNSFKLMTSLSLDDVNTQGSTIGFYPDTADSWQFAPAGTGAVYGQGVCNNSNFDTVTPVSGAYNKFKSGGGNVGFIERQQYINFDGEGVMGDTTLGSLLIGGAGILTGNQSLIQCWKSYIYNKVAQTSTGTPATQGKIQYAVVATVYLKHIHSFFNMCPLLKGVFIKMTMNLNNTTTSFRATSSAAGIAAVTPFSLTCTEVSNPLGGVNPLMLASGFGTGATANGSRSLFPAGDGTAALPSTITIEYRMNLSVGGECLDTTLKSSGGYQQGTLSRSIYLYIPAYSFNPIFEDAYLASPVKQIKYTDVYQYQVLNVASTAPFNNLLTNGIANIKSVLILPFYSTNGSNAELTTDTVPCSVNTGFRKGTPVFQSPFDPAGTGPTSPMCWLSNFNIQISGQNAIYNVQRYNFEQFNNQLYGQNAVNGGLTDGITSGLIDRQKFDMEYSYYYVNVERMLPVEMSVPKSVQILGQNFSSKIIDLYCFIEYGCEVSIDALTGARV